MTRPLWLPLGLLLPLLAAGCGQVPDYHRNGGQGAYLSSGFGGH